jgi:alkyl sulfatase BDS1-like metallo-beta-lactamase superfamily hydrolase
VIAHENVVRRYRRYQETTGLQNRLHAAQFRHSLSSIPHKLPLTFPDQTYREALTIGGPLRQVQLHWAPSETDDVTAVWLPRDRILYGSAAVLPSIPNIGTPLRTMRDPVRWADTLDRLAALLPSLLIPEFRDPLREDINEMLTTTAQALRWLRAEVVARLNQGMGVERIIHDLDYPTELFDRPWMDESYGHREYIVRDIVRSETGWWDGNPTTLHPCTPDAVATLVADAITDKDAVLTKARALRDEGQLQAALHVVDLLATAASIDATVAAARELKTELCQLRSREVSSYVSRSLYQVNDGNRLFR